MHKVLNVAASSKDVLMSISWDSGSVDRCCHRIFVECCVLPSSSRGRATPWKVHKTIKINKGTQEFVLIYEISILMSLKKSVLTCIKLICNYNFLTFGSDDKLTGRLGFLEFLWIVGGPIGYSIGIYSEAWILSFWIFFEKHKKQHVN